MFCTIGWNLATDELAVGQWCKHKLYPHACDISADGVWLSYFALNGRWSSETRGAWRAISRAPYLKAVHVVPHGTTWGIDRYQHRLLRDGWLHQASADAGDAYEKSCGRWMLRKKLARREWHQVRSPDGVVYERRTWEWADVDQRRNRIVWAEAGVIRGAAIAGDRLGEPTLVFDARDMMFQAIEAPYDDATVIHPPDVTLAFDE